MPKDHPTSSNRLFNVLYFNRKSTIYLYIVVGSSVTLTVNKLQATPVIHSNTLLLPDERAITE